MKSFAPVSPTCPALIRLAAADEKRPRNSLFRVGLLQYSRESAFGQPRSVQFRVYAAEAIWQTVHLIDDAWIAPPPAVLMADLRALMLSLGATKSASAIPEGISPASSTTSKQPMS